MRPSWLIYTKWTCPFTLRQKRSQLDLLRQKIRLNGGLLHVQGKRRYICRTWHTPWGCVGLGHDPWPYSPLLNKPLHARARYKAGETNAYRREILKYVSWSTTTEEMVYCQCHRGETNFEFEMRHGLPASYSLAARRFLSSFHAFDLQMLKLLFYILYISRMRKAECNFFSLCLHIFQCWNLHLCSAYSVDLLQQ